jgi:hypothetical protein
VVVKLETDFHLPLDVWDELLPPLTVFSDRSATELGFEPTTHTGYWTLDGEWV